MVLCLSVCFCFLTSIPVSKKDELHTGQGCNVESESVCVCALHTYTADRCEPRSGRWGRDRAGVHLSLFRSLVGVCL